MVFECPYCKSPLQDKSAVACIACKQKWDKTYAEWDRAVCLWWWIFLLFGTLSFLSSAFVSGWFRLGFSEISQAAENRIGVFFGNAALNPLTWVFCFALVMFFRAIGRRGEAAVREGRLSPIES